MKGKQRDVSIIGKLEQCKQRVILKARKIYIHKSKLSLSSKEYLGGHKRILYVVLISTDGDDEHFFQIEHFLFNTQTNESFAVGKTLPIDTEKKKLLQGRLSQLTPVIPDLG